MICCRKRFIIISVEGRILQMGGCLKPTDKQKKTEELKRKSEETTLDSIQIERNISFTPPRPDHPYFSVNQNLPTQNHIPMNQNSKKSCPKIGSICPLLHPITNTEIVYKQLSTCNKCHTRYNYKQNIKSFSLFYRCTDCKFQLCCKCLPLKHQDICTQPSLTYCKTNKFKIVGYSKTGSMIKCCFCASKINNFIYCASCKAGACASCMDLKKNLKCEHKLQFNQKQNMLCVYCQKFGHGFIECNKCQIQMCPGCYTNVYLKQ